MNCKEYRELIEDALDISLHGDPEKRVKLHLEHCDACRAYFERRRAEHIALFTGINAVYSGLHLPEEFADRLVTSVRTRKVGRRVWRHFSLPKWSLVAASLVAMVGFAFAAKVVVEGLRGAEIANQDAIAANQDVAANQGDIAANQDADGGEMVGRVVLNAPDSPDACQLPTTNSKPTKEKHP